MKSSRSVRTIAVAFALFLAAAGCTSDDPASEAATTTAPAAAGTTTTTVAVAESVLGETEVQVVSRLPLLTMEWRTVELEPNAAGAWLTSLAAVDGKFVATAMVWNPDGGTQTVVQWWSTDTITWERTETVLTGSWMNQVVPVGDLLVGLGSSSDPNGPGTPLLWIDEGSGWETRELGLPSEPGSSLYLYGVAATDAGLVLAGDRQPYDPVQATILSTDGFGIEIDNNTGAYVVTEEASGRVVTSGPTSDIYQWSETGQILYDPATGDVITEVPWDRWSELYPDSSPLPIAVPADPQAAPPTIEYDGFRITVDEVNGVFEIVQLASGDLISGSVSDLYRGPAPRFVDDRTGETVLTFSWEEWDALVNRAWDERVDVHEPHDTETVVMFSPDSYTWEAQTLNLAPNTHLEALTTVDDHFVLTVLEHYDGGSNRMAWTSEDGRAWENVGAIGPETVLQVVARPDSLVALAEGTGHPRVVSSQDGLTWREELAIDVQNDGRDAWLERISAGPLGTVVSGTVYPVDPDAPLAISIGGKTARFGPDWAVEITDDAIGEVILALTWDQIENPDGDRPVTYEDQATWFWDAAGQLVMKIPDDDVYAMYTNQSEAADERVSGVLFLKTPDGAWFEVTPPTRSEPTSEPHIVVGDDVVIIGRMTWLPGESEESQPDSIQLLVGTPAR